MKYLKVMSVLLAITLILCGCSATINKNVENEEEITVSKSADDIVVVDDMFTDRDLNYDYADRDVFSINLKDNASNSNSNHVKISGNKITIKKDGVYVISGSLSNGQIIVNADDNDKVQLVLNGANINCNTSSAIYCKSAKKLFVTTVKESSLSNKEDFVNDTDENINGVIYSKSNLTLNGSKKLCVNANYGNCVVSKDDLAITGGEYDLVAQKHTLKGNDSVRIANASLNLDAQKDAIHSENDKVEKGFVYIESGSIIINAQDEGIQSSSAVKICGGDIDIQNSKEGIEGRFIDVAGGSIKIKSTDDGINATDKSQEDADSSADTQNNMPSFPNDAPNDMPSAPNDNTDAPKQMDQNPPTPPDDNKQMQAGGFGKMGVGSTDCSLTISGGSIEIDASGDGLDSNGIIKIIGGETVVYGAENNGNSAFDYETQATITGGSFVAIGMSGMAQGFSNSSTQGSILYNLEAVGSKNDKIQIIKNKKAIVEATAVKKYNSILVSSPELVNGKYTLKAGDVEKSVRLKSISYSNAKENAMPEKMQNKKEPFQKAQ